MEAVRLRRGTSQHRTVWAAVGATATSSRLFRLARLSVCSVCSVVSFAGAVPARAQGPAHAVVLIAMDGVRWQDLFHGADTALISRRMGGVGDTAGLRKEFWRADPRERRRIIFPFIWDSVATHGSIWGSPDAESDARVTNGLNFSYPGYNEMLTGRADSRIDKNDYGPNPNVTVFEWLNTRPGLRGRVSAFATWGVFNDIFNKDRSAHLVFAGWAPPASRAVGTHDATLDRLYRTTTRVWGDNAFDALMQTALLDHVKRHKPRALFVGYGETDDWAHSRRYDLTLRSARSADAFIAELWNTMQAMREYRGRTTFIILTDHGRGEGDKWTDHGEDVDGAGQIWIAAMGPGIPSAGELRGSRVTQAQVAATVASLLGEEFTRFESRAAPPLVGRAP